MKPSRGSDDSASLELATLLKRFRTRAGLSQQLLAEKAAVSVQAVSALERGYRKIPYPNTLERLCDALELCAQDRHALDEATRRLRGARLHERVAPAHNLPRRLTSFLGREAVVEEIVEIVRNAPLVSVAGTGGVGKTRVAIEVAARLLDDFPDGIYFVELAPLTDPDLVTHALAAALGVQESANASLLGTLAAHIASKRVLIVLDNCEHVIDQTRRVVGSLLRECGKLQFLTTTREALTITGERAYRLPPLPVPDRDVASPSNAIRYGAIALFVDRVRASDARFSLHDENLAAVVEICRRLDGLPLAIELAAARTTVFSPAQIAQRLDSIFEILVPSDRAALARHETMRSVIEWSYELLSSQAKQFFDRLSVFASSFSLETATAVCSDGAIAAEDVLGLLSSLIGQSLVMAEFSRGEARYHMLEATRQFARQNLELRGERERTGRAHAGACLMLAEDFDRDWYVADERRWFHDAATELDNIRAALEWALRDGNDIAIGCRIAGSLARVWYSFAPVEGRNWVRYAVAHLDGYSFPGVMRSLHIADAELCGALGEYSASHASALRALEIDEPPDGLASARARQAAGSALGALGRADEAESLLRQAARQAQLLDNRRLRALALGDMGTVRSRSGDAAGARAFYDEALTYYNALHLERPAASIAGNLAEIEFASGDVAAALQLAEEARAGHEAWSNRRSTANDLCNMAAYLVAMDCFDDARAHAQHALRLARDLRATVLTLYILQHFAAIGALDRHPARSEREARERAGMLLGFVNARLGALDAGREHTERQEYDRIIAALRSQLWDRLGGVLELGERWSEDDAVAATASL